MKIEMKINRYIRLIGKDDLILDNGACVRVMTQRGAWGDWHYTPLTMSKKMFNELKKFDFIYLDEEKTKQENKHYKEPWLFCYRFNIDKMIKSGGYKAVE